MMRGKGGISRWRNRRRLLLISFALAYIVIGISYISIPPELSGSLTLIVRTAPLWIWGAIWIVCGAGMIIAAVHHWRDKLGGDFGFGIGVAMPALWGVLSFASTFFGAERGWVTAIVYWTMATAITASAGMVDPRFWDVEN